MAELIGLVVASPGPRLVILNTVQNAAVVAKSIRDAGHSVYHISTALTPSDRAKILTTVSKQLRHVRAGGSGNWSLVATSCIEAGVDLSFRTAFRERFSVASILQVAGRVNRHGEYTGAGGSEVFDFALSDSLITQHPAAKISADVLHSYMKDDLLNKAPPSRVVTDAMVDEVNRIGGLGTDPLSEAERERDYPRVKELGRVIDAQTRFVVVESGLQKALERGEQVTWRRLLEGSVQLWVRRIEHLGLRPARGHKDVYIWPDDYDAEFLGLMSGVLARATATGGTGDFIA